MAAPKVGILGQANPGVNAPADAYTVPPGRRAVISTLLACNQGGGAATAIRAWARINGAAVGNGNAICYDIPLAANSHQPFTYGMTLGPGDVLTVQAGTANVTWTVFGEETDVPTA